MPARSRPGDAAAPASEAQHPLLVCLVAWLVPGAGHFMLGWNRKALVFFGTLAFMYIVGLLLGGRLFPLQMSEPLVFLSAIAQWAVGLLRLTALVGGFGYGDVVAPGYEVRQHLSDRERPPQRIGGARHLRHRDGATGPMTAAGVPQQAKDARACE